MRLAFAIALLLALNAQATWTSSQVTGVPVDVTIVDGGVVVASSAEAAVFSGTLDAGITKSQFLPVFFLASATWRGPNCLIGLTSSASLVFHAACGTGPGYPTVGGAAVAGRLRTTSTGAIYAYAATNIPNHPVVLRLEADAGALASDWVPLTPGSTDAPAGGYPLSTVALPGGVEVAAVSYATTLFPVPLVDVYVDAGLHRTLQPATALKDLWLYENAGRGGAVAIDATGLAWINPDLLGDGGFTAVAGLPAANVTAALTASGGTAYGQGFGMITNGMQLYGAVPNPAAPGQAWLLRDAGFPNALVRAACRDPGFCAAITNNLAGSNVYVYFNEFAPAAQVVPVPLMQGASVVYTLDAGDRDGDPIWVTWTDGGFYWDGGDSRVVTLTAPATVCGTANAPDVMAMVSDGWAAHDTPVTIQVIVSGSPVLPPVVAPGVLPLTAGGSAVGETAVVAGGGCGGNGISWSLPGDGGFSLAIDGGFVLVTPPATWCSKDAGTWVLTATATGVADASTDISVVLEPWGNPNPPDFGSPSPRQQLAGSTVSYAPDASNAHDCQQASGFPAMRLSLVSYDGGGVAVVTTFGADLSVSSADECVGGLVVASATRSLVPAPAQVSTPGTLLVQLVPNPQPITAATPFDAFTSFRYDAGMSLASGVFIVGADCLDAGRALVATVVINGEDGGPVGDGGGSAPGPWAVPVRGGCAGGSFVAVATLYADDGGVGPSLTYPFSTSAVVAKLPPLLTAGVVPVTCEGGARGTLELDLTTLECQAEQFTWSGPALVDSPATGARVSFATATGDLQTQAGTELSWSVTASIGPNNFETGTRSVRLVPAAFVEISHRTDVPVAREEEAVTVEVRLHNLTTCAVSGLVLHEELGGLKLIAGTIRVAGQRTQPTLGDGFLEVEDLALAGDGVTTLTYLARVPLLSAARPRAQALFRGTDVTIGPTGLERPSTGCGCEASPTGTLALLFLGVLLRSRRASG